MKNIFHLISIFVGGKKTKLDKKNPTKAFAFAKSQIHFPVFPKK